MALVPAILTEGLASFAKTPPQSVADAAKSWASMYYSYAQGAMALDALPTTLLPTVQETLSANFFVAMQAQQFLTQLPVCLTTFWQTPAIMFAGASGIGPVASVSGAPALTAALTAMALQNMTAPPPRPLDALAQALDVFTRSVIVGLVNPVGVLIPTPLL